MFAKTRKALSQSWYNTMQRKMNQFTSRKKVGGLLEILRFLISDKVDKINWVWWHTLYGGC